LSDIIGRLIILLNGIQSAFSYKINVEGEEWEVLKSAEQTIIKYRRAIPEVTRVTRGY
jgi:hypothetical protein